MAFYLIFGNNPCLL